MNGCNSQFYINSFIKEVDPSIKKICHDAEQVVVYGWADCLYTDVIIALENIFKKVFDFRIGKIKKETITLEGDVIKKFPYISNVKETKRCCKTGLVNLIFENYKRSINGMPIIPLLFVVDIENNPYEMKSSSLTSRTNNKMTVSELRRIYKLCKDLEGEQKKISEIAKQTVKFVKLTLNSEDKCELVEIKPFWKASDWKTHWVERKSTPKSPESLFILQYDNKNISWKNDLVKAVDALQLSA